MVPRLKMSGCIFHALVLTVSLATGCGGSGIADAPAPVCVAGSQVACACAGGGQGVQVCQEDGAALGICMACPMLPFGGTGGEAGAGRSAGSGGGGGPTCEGERDCAGTLSTGGAGGAGETTPNPGTGGAAGTGGAPGTGGRARSGSGGSGGTAAAAGGAGATAGRPGTAGVGGSSLAGSGGRTQTDGGTRPDAATTGSGGAGGSAKDGVITDAGASASGGRADASTPGGDPESLVNVEIIQCLIGPSKSDGTEWDFSATVPSSVTTALASALGFPGVGPIINFLATPSIAALSKPDPYGTAELDWNGTGFDAARTIVLANPTNNMDNTFQPLWLGTRGWASLPQSAPLMIRVTLMDEDLIYDDAIGVATISGAEIRAAFAAGGTYWVRTDEMTVRQILAIGIQVTPARAP